MNWRRSYSDAEQVGSDCVDEVGVERCEDCATGRYRVVPNDERCGNCALKVGENRCCWMASVALVSRGGAVDESGAGGCGGDENENGLGSG